MLHLLTGEKTMAELCRAHQLTAQMIGNWKRQFLEAAPQAFAQGSESSAEQERMAELERLVGKLTLALEIAKKSLVLAEWDARQKRRVAMRLQADYPVTSICEVLALPRSTFYRRARVSDDSELQAALRELAGQYLTYGYRRLSVLLKGAGWTVNHKRVQRLMVAMGLQHLIKRRKTRTTNSQLPFPRYPNLVREARRKRLCRTLDRNHSRGGNGPV